jgi:hypothetical protein
MSLLCFLLLLFTTKLTQTTTKKPQKKKKKKSNKHKLTIPKPKYISHKTTIFNVIRQPQTYIHGQRQPKYTINIKDYNHTHINNDKNLTNTNKSSQKHKLTIAKPQYTQ